MESLSVTGTNAPILVKALSSTTGSVALRTGDIIQAKVIASSHNSAVLKIGDLRMPVSTGLTLTPGERIALMVIEMRPDRVILKQLKENKGSSESNYSKDELLESILKDAGLTGRDLAVARVALRGSRIDIGKGAEELVKVLGNAGDGIDDRSIRSLLSSIMELVVESGDSNEIEAKLRALVKTLSYESHLLKHLEGDIAAVDSFKAGLLERLFLLQQGGRHASDSGMEALKASIERILDMLNSIEAFNVTGSPADRRMLYLPLPVRVGDELQTVDIKIFARGSGRKGLQDASLITIAFALDMPHLGKTRALLEVAGKTVNLSLSTERSEGIELAKQFFNELEESLQQMGYTIGRLSAAEMRDDNAREKSLIEEKIGMGLEGIDVRV